MLNSKFDLYKSEWLDLVFTDRNKNYGAYELRVNYSDTMMKALAITVVAFGLAATTLTIVMKHNKANTIEAPMVDKGPIIVDLTIIKPPVDKPLEPLKKDATKQSAVKPDAAPKSNTKTQRFVEPRPTNNPIEAVDPKPVDMNVAIGSQEIKGNDDTPVGNALKPAGTGGNGTSTVGVDGGSNEPVGIGGLDVMPEPIGGASAWSRFLQKTLRYPETELQGRVVLSFVIEKDGKLTDIQVIKGVSPELDREALRVLKLAPAWKPGQQNGHPVRVKFTVPIVFQMSEN
ncbi:energy transducer TonB [Mucilaginibacter aquatilis]|uniref:TonB family protein n=1 Tax=Mucilaginibacter aquatilis TaxID=1517760 RepID=A0A6I4I857_9SPHI|nr:energy transducer TonB [Mucilaginibacter aquatilis]MVN91087.1 TonB family protein [Mucilaginibacter aquatilis]